MGTPEADAIEEIEDAIFANGLLPADRESQARAWRATIEASKLAFSEGSRECVATMAPAALSDAGGDPVAAARILLRSCYLFADDADITEALGLVWAGDFLNAVRKAVATGEAQWIARADEEESALRFELGGWAELKAERGAEAILAALPDTGDFVAGLMEIHALVTADIAEAVAAKTVKRLAQPPVRQFVQSIDADPFSGSWQEPDTAAQALHHKATALIGIGITAATPSTNFVEPARDLELRGPKPASMQALGPMSPDIEKILQRALTDMQEHAVSRVDGAATSRIRSLLVGADPSLHAAGGIRRIVLTPFVFVDPATLPRRQWLYGRHLIRGEISLTLAPGGVGKTSLAVAEAASLVSGRHLLHDQPIKPLRVWLWNGEEPDDELARRFSAVALHYGLSAPDFADRLFIDNGHDLPLVLAEQSRDGVKVHTPLVDELVEALRERQVDIMLVDPFVSTHGVNENDNSAIQKAASAWKEVAQRAGVAIGLAHHVRKLAGRDATAEDSRGGDALVSKVRDARTLNPMSKEDATRLGIAPSDRASFFSTGTGGKSNMAPKSDRRSWFRLVSVGLGNGGGLTEPQDTVAVVTPWSPPNAADEIEATAVMRLASVMSGRQWRGAAQSQKREDWVGRAVATAFDIEQVEGFEARAKRMIAALEKAGVLVKDTATGPKREAISIMRLGDLSAFETELN